MQKKVSSHPFLSRMLPSTVCETGVRKGATSADKALFGANKVLVHGF